MINITPINVVIKNQIATQLKIRAEFYTSDNTSRVFWELLNEDNLQLLNGDMVIPTATHNAWGVDDSVIEDYVLTQLNLERE